ncbi:MAG: type I 3-dehydroquinate dehydratase [Bacteroidales bacterium]|nr:type I 3-dehydroquinate dehydratase [Bacteroidales bacterium]
MICTSLQNKTYGQILEILEDPTVEMAEIRLDRCPLTDEQIEELFSESDIPLIATCRIAESASEQEASRRLRIAIEAGARFADLEIEAPAPMSRAFQQLCRRNGTEIIRSYHNFEETPQLKVLQMALARCFRYGADIAKIVTTCHDAQDAALIESLYTIVLEDVDSLQGRLVAFGMGAEGRSTRLECLRRGAPFTYAALNDEEATAPGQWSVAEMNDALYGDRPAYRAEARRMPASKSFAQRAILAAALASGTSHLHGYSPCGDSDAALRVAEALGATVRLGGSELSVTGIGAQCRQLQLDRLDTGESGLLTRLSIPVLAAIGNGSFTVEGHGTLLRRPLGSAADIMAAFGVLLSNASEREGKEVFVPASVKGHLIPGTADVPGQGGSQLISGLLMALPLCDKDSLLHVSEPKSIPYMYITLDVLRHFGIRRGAKWRGTRNCWRRRTGPPARASASRSADGSDTIPLISRSKGTGAPRPTTS